MSRAVQELKEKVLEVFEDYLRDAMDEVGGTFDRWAKAEASMALSMLTSATYRALAMAKDPAEPIRFLERRAAREMGQALMEQPGIVSTVKDYDFSRDAALRRYGLTVIAADPSATGAGKDYVRESSGAATLGDIESGKAGLDAQGGPGCPPECCTSCAPPIDIPVAPLDPASYF
jgi:hypothetical protein